MTSKISSTKNFLSSVLLASRPKTLTAAISPVIVGASLGIKKLDQQIGQENLDHSSILSSLGLFLVITLTAILIQILTNLVNDLWDFKSGKDTSDRIGPKRAVQAGLITPEKMFKVISFLTILITTLGLYLVTVGGYPILIIGILSIISAYAYTAGPYPLAYNGLGDIFVLIFFGPVAVMGTEYLFTNSFSLDAALLGLVLGCAAVNLLIINNTRDIAEDTKTNKRTLAVRYGRNFCNLEFELAFILPILFLLFFGQIYVLSFSSWLLIIYLIWSLYFYRSKFFSLRQAEDFNKYLGVMGRYLFLTGVVCCVSVWL